MKNLISMVDYVLQDESMSSSNIINYAKFLKQPLELWMFVPCDEDMSVLSNPKDSTLQYYERNEKYQQAKETCIFEGCVYDKEMDAVRKYIGLMIYSVKYDSNDTIEDLVKYNLHLTKTAIKKLGL